MKVKKIKPDFKDERGIVQDILTREQIDYVSLITSKKGAVRGNHYHKETVQWLYLYSGKLKSLTQKDGRAIIARMMYPGDLLITDKMEKHAVMALKDSVFFVFTRGPRGGKDYEKDTYRLKKPLGDFGNE